MNQHTELSDTSTTEAHANGGSEHWAGRNLRRAADRLSEDGTGRDVLLRAADTVEALEEKLPQLFSREGLDDLERNVRDHPFAAMAVAVGAGFLLERTHIVQAVVGGLASGGGALAGAAFSRGHRHGTAAEDQLLAWLNDAYAMEMAQIPILENHAEDARREPDVRDRHLEHLRETKQHARDIRRCIAHLGEKPSVTKKAIGRVTGAMESVATEPFQDELMKNALMDYAAEHFEIACYRSLIAAAKEAGHPKIARVCEQILEEEEAMAEWLQDHLVPTVHRTLASHH
ncbi:MAG TPA: ferritin-like domain-containing protein [Longimicrobiales bacterium]|nr:ferritin-like domain-containing protein [Longimicrobiales bacterium]